MGTLYRLFGLVAESDVALPGLAPHPAALHPDVRLHLAAEFPSGAKGTPAAPPLYVSAGREASGEPHVQVWAPEGGDWFRFRYADGTEFAVHRAAGEVFARWAAHSTLEDTCTYLFGPIFGFLLRLRGVPSLHASAVRVNGHAVLLAGGPGAGKSTTATAFARQGYAVLSDDVSPLIERGEDILVQPTHPHLRLWPAAVEALFASPDALPRLTPNWDKRYFDLAGAAGRFEQQPLPLGAVYLLDERAAGEAPRIRALPPREALLEMVANTYVNYLLDSAMRAREFQLLGRVAGRVPVRRVTPPDDPRRIAELCRAIAGDFTLCAAPAGARG